MIERILEEIDVGEDDPKQTTSNRGTQPIICFCNFPIQSSTSSESIGVTSIKNQSKKWQSSTDSSLYSNKLEICNIYIKADDVFSSHNSIQ